jgi:polypeptide N-acetylgalactosaminyltransferase
MNRQYFWDVGAYDDGLRVWQGEQLEMSLKAHLCGHGMLEVPCSRVAYSYRNKNYYKRFGDDGQDYMIRNYKRIAEVWLDGYKEKVYERNRAKYAEADVGDLLRAKAIKRGLHCKPFSYFLEFVAPEMLERYPLVDLGYFAQGCVQSKASPNLCLEVPPGAKLRGILLKDCEKNLIKPSSKQFFKLGWHRNIQHFNFDFCLKDTLTMSECHYSGGNQLWKYDLVTLTRGFTV